MLQKRSPAYDKDREEHYNLISALHKSVRGSDPDAALYWLARMLEGGEDPLFIARRLVRMAVEDIGEADPTSLILAIAAKDAYDFLGSPEGELALAQVVRAHGRRAQVQRRLHRLRRAPARMAKETGSLMPPAHIRNAPDPADEGPRLRQGLPLRPRHRGRLLRPELLPRRRWSGRSSTRPKGEGAEARIKERLERWAALRDQEGRRVKRQPPNLTRRRHRLRPLAGDLRGRRRSSRSTSRPGSPARAGGSQAHTLDDLLAAFAKSNGKRPRLVHRLDRDTSGVILTAKTKPAAAFLGKALMGRRVREDLPRHRRARRARARATAASRRRCAATSRAARPTWRLRGRPPRRRERRAPRYRTLAAGDEAALVELRPAHRPHAPAARAPGLDRPPDRRRRPLRRRAGAGRRGRSRG